VSHWAPFIISAATSAMVALPLAPALIELRRRRDALPLVSRTDDGKIDNFAQSMRDYLAPVVTHHNDQPSTVKMDGVLRDGAQAIVISTAVVCDLPGTPLDVVAYVPQSVAFPFPLCFLRELYVRGNLRVAAHSLLRTVLVEGDATLGEGTAVVRWIHAGGSLEAGAKARLLGRASAGGDVRLHGGCEFQRVNGRKIQGGAGELRTLERSSMKAISSSIELGSGRLRSQGDFHLGDGDSVQGNIIGRRRVKIGQDVRVLGSVKAKSDMEIASGTDIEGAIVSGGHVRIGRGCFVRGPVLSEGEVVIAAGTQIGSLKHPTTVSAPRIRLASGATVCGTIWARESGEVTA